MNECPCSEFAAVPRTWPEVIARLEEAERIAPMLEPLATDDESWMSEFRCRACGSTWVGERPFSERHGGGPDLLYRIAGVDPLAWLRHAAPLADELRRAAEDREFFDTLGPEVGPERCRESGCRRLRMDPGLYCRCHHFEMVMRRSCPFWNLDTD